MIAVDRRYSPAKRIGIDSQRAVAGLVITLVVFIGHYGLPERRLTLYPNGTQGPDLQGVIDAESGNSSYWLNDENTVWVCDYRKYHSYSCSWNLDWRLDSIDLSPYDAVNITLEYAGPATRIRLFMRNFNPGYSHVDDPVSTKFMSMTVPVIELEKSVHISLEELHVASWWVRERHIGRQWALPEFNEITTVGLDFIEPGIHQTRIQEIVLRGRWIDTETLLLGIIGFWMAVMLADGVVRLYCYYASAQTASRRIRGPQHTAHHLQKEGKDLMRLADTDPLTGTFNRSGMQAQIASLFGRHSAVDEIGLVLINIDNFKHLNDTHGYDTGDRVLKALAAALSANLRSSDILARWSDDTFLILCQRNSDTDLSAFAEKLREVIENCAFGYSADVTVTVSIGVTRAQTGIGFEKAFRRAAQALNRAKTGGKNRVEIEL